MAKGKRWSVSDLYPYLWFWYDLEFRNRQEKLNNGR